jgi:hypothetical protein
LAFSLDEHVCEFDRRNEALPVGSHIIEIIGARGSPGKMNARLNSVGNKPPETVDPIPSMFESDNLANWQLCAYSALEPPSDETRRARD